MTYTQQLESKHLKLWTQANSEKSQAKAQELRAQAMELYRQLKKQKSLIK